MPPLKQHPHVIRLTAAVLIVTVLQACTSSQVRPLEPAQFSPSAHAGKAHLTLVDGGTLTLLNPVIRGDSLFGNRAPSLSPVALAVTNIAWGEAEQTDGSTTAYVVAGIVLVVVIVLAIALCAGDTYFC